MNVFITGGTGFVGQAILRRLSTQGHTIRALTRSLDPRVREQLARFGGTAHCGDVTEAKSLSGALSGIDAVVHLVGIISEAGERTFENIHTLGTQNLTMAARQAGVRRFLQMSALGTRPQAVSRYHQTKWAAEVIVRQSGLDYTIFRPSLIYGPHDQFVNLFAKMSRFSPMLPVLSSEWTRFQPVAVEVVATAFSKALTEPRSAGQTYDLCGPDTLTFPQILDEILGVLGRKRVKVRVPLRLARCQAALLEWIYPRLLGKAPPLNRDQLVMLQEDNVGNARPANDLFALKSPSFRQGIAVYLRKK